MELLTWLETTGIAIWVREGESIWAFPMVLTLHTFGLTLLVGTAVIVNLRLLGVAQPLPLASLRPLFAVMWTGFWLNAVTGTLLFVADATERGSSTFFLAKLLFVALGVATMVLIKRSLFDAPANPAAARPPAKVLAIVSLVTWAAATMTGRLLAYV